MFEVELFDQKDSTGVKPCMTGWKIQESFFDDVVCYPALPGA